MSKVYRALEFEQECWMRDCIKLNTEFRKKGKSEFEKDFYKLKNNSVFGKTMENLRNRTDIKLVPPMEERKIRKLVASPLFAGKKEMAHGLMAVHKHKSRLRLNKPVYTGMSILENSKVVCELLYTDTDSLLLEIEMEDVYEDMAKNADLYDTSDYPKNHPLHSEKNMKVLGKMKDGMKGQPLAEVVCLRPKMYSFPRADDVVRKQKEEG